MIFWDSMKIIFYFCCRSFEMTFTNTSTTHLETDAITFNCTTVSSSDAATSFLIELQEMQDCLENKYFEAVSLTVVCITIVSTVLGNSLIIVSYTRYKVFQRASVYKLIFHVAIADWLVGISLLTFPIKKAFPKLIEIKALCICRIVMVTISLCASVMYLAMISTDRFFAVMFPMKYMMQRSSRRFIAASIGTWAFCVASGLILIRENKLTKSGFQGTLIACPVTWIVDENISVISTFMMLTSIIVNAIMYAFILNKMIRRRRNSSSLSVVHGKSVSKTKLMIIVYIVFAICWGPCIFMVLYVWAQPNDTRLKCYREHSITFGYFNSGLNWILYGIGNNNYRKAFQRLLFSCKSTDMTFNLNNVRPENNQEDSTQT